MTTAIKDYERLEAQGVWWPAPDAQRRDVVVKLGTASLVISDFQDRPLSHWSLPAVRRLNPGLSPACFAPVGSDDEKLELDDDAADMVAAIARLSHALDRGKKGRLRRIAAAALTALLVFAALFWVPELLRRQALSVSSEAQRAETGRAMLDALSQSAGAPCTTARGQRSLAALASRLSPEQRLRLVVMPALERPSLALPGGLIAIDRSLIEDHDSPDYAAGEIMAALLTAEDTPPFERLIAGTSLPALIGFLTSGQIADSALAEQAERALRRASPSPEDADWIAAMRARALPMQGYVVARRRLGLTVSPPIIEAAASETDTQPVLGDQDWLSLQRVCE